MEGAMPIGVGAASSAVKLVPGQTVDRYLLETVLGSGSYGQVYRGRDTQNGDLVAIKLESPDTRPHLEDEAKIYEALAGGEHFGIPRMHHYGHHKQYNVLVMDLLGQSLENILNMQNRKMSLKTVLMIADQTLSATEFIHSKKILHRDVKPANFVVGIGPWRNQVFYVDFGLAKYYVDRKTGEHIPYREGKSLTGTARYASIATHAGIEQSRRDDLESLAYIYIYLLTGSLPWQGLQRPKAKTKKEKYQRIHDSKAMTTPESLCAGYPVEFAAFLDYVKSLSFTQDPDYNYMKSLFRNLYRRLDFPYDLKFDWSDDPAIIGDMDLTTETFRLGSESFDGSYYTHEEEASSTDEDSDRSYNNDTRT